MRRHRGSAAHSRVEAVLTVEITFLAAPSEAVLPAHVVGPVVEQAENVEIYLIDGRVVRTSTFGAPSEPGAIRFYATEIPALPSASHGPPRVPIRKLVGLDRDGEIVACLINPVPPGGMSLSDCR